MKIEAEVDDALRAFTSAERRKGGGGSSGCSVNGGSLPPIAQDSERPSIGEQPVRPPSLQQPTTTKPGRGPADPDAADRPPLTSAFDCEHFQFIDDDDDEEEATPAAAATPNGTAVAATGHDDDGHLPPGREVKSGEDTPQPNGMSERGDSSDVASAVVQRQASVDGDKDAADNVGVVKKELRSVLKKGKTTRHKGRITFDEAVTLYSDECEDVQLLALSMGPDIGYAEEYYAFDPPIEYQDVPPFEPPAEYRDSDEVVSLQLQPSAQPPDDQQQQLQAAEESHRRNGKPDIAEREVEEIASSDRCDDVDVSKATGTAPDPCRPETATTEADALKSESTEESDKLFERFLEAEREFAVDEELNNVFHVLENDFANDGRNSAFDDNFFRKLINLLSSVEGDVPVEDTDLFSSTNFVNSEENGIRDAEDDDISQTHSRTLSEADSDCSISSQDTIIVRLGEEDGEQCSGETNSQLPDSSQENCDRESPKDDKAFTENGEAFDEVFNEASTPTPESAAQGLLIEEKPPRPLPRESLLKNAQAPPVTAPKPDKASEESLSRQSSSEQSASGNSQEPLQDADDSTSSDSRSGEVEEEIRLDDIGYDEEDAEDYDEESFRGMAHGNSKIRRIIKKNALQCTIFRGIDAKRRQQPGAKYPRPKSPLLSQESLVEKLKWLTTIDEHKDQDGPLNFHSKPPDVILSTGGIPVNGSLPHSASSEDDMGNQAMNYSHPQMYPVQQRHVVGPNGQSGYYPRHDGFPPSLHPSLPRQRMAFPGQQHPQMMQHNLPSYPPNRVVAHPSPSQQPPWPEQHQRPVTSMTVPRNFRDWRVIQRVMVNRNNVDQQNSRSQVPADYVRCPNGAVGGGYPVGAPPDVSRTSQAPSGGNKDELEQFVEQDSKRIERIRKRYSLAEDDDDPTFGFARRPSVRGIQNRIGQAPMNPGMQSNPSDIQGPSGFNHVGPYTMIDESGQGSGLVHPRMYSAEQMRMWSRDPNWRPDGTNQSLQYGSLMRGERTQVPMHIHRASVALTELPGSATIPHVHRKPHPDTRYHSYAESMYGSTRTLPTNVWIPPDARTFHNVSNPAGSHQSLQATAGNISGVSGPMLQVPPQHTVTANDERGVPEGASSSPKISSDSLYHGPVPETIQAGAQHKEDGMIYYSLNV